MWRRLLFSVAALLVCLLAFGVAQASGLSAQFKCSGGSVASAPGLLDGLIYAGGVTCVTPSPSWFLYVDSGAVQPLNQLWLYEIKTGNTCPSAVIVQVSDDNVSFYTLKTVSLLCDTWASVPLYVTTRYVTLSSVSSATFTEIALTPVSSPPGGYIGPNLTWSAALAVIDDWMSSDLVHGIVVFVLVVILGTSGLVTVFHMLAPGWFGLIVPDVADWAMGRSSRVGAGSFEKEARWVSNRLGDYDTPYEGPSSAAVSSSASRVDENDAD